MKASSIIPSEAGSKIAQKARPSRPEEARRNCRSNLSAPEAAALPRPDGWLKLYNRLVPFLLVET